MSGYHKKLFLRNLNSKYAGTHNIEEKIKLFIENYYSKSPGNCGYVYI